ncbi:MAG: hypothetical protein Fur0032_19920 [Terrimicrobiaceae bacterium]
MRAIGFLLAAWGWMLCLAVALAQEANSVETLLKQASEEARAGDFMAEKALLEEALRAEPGNLTAKARLRKASENAARALAAEKVLENVLLPKVDFADVSVKEAFDFLAQSVAKQRGDGSRVNLVWLVPPETMPSVTIQLTDIPASAAMKLVAESAGLKVAFEPHAVKVSAP